MNLSEMFQFVVATVSRVGTFRKDAEKATHTDVGAVTVANQMHSADNYPDRGLAINRTLGSAMPLLEEGSTFFERTDAIKIALRRGIPLYEIEDYLDWLDMFRPTDLPIARPEHSEDDFRRVA